jgi:hypothetical protein
VLMTRILLSPLLVAGALSLQGCVASVAASAVGMAARSARGQPQSNEHLQSVARQACEAHAAQYGATHIIDVEQRSTSRIIVWGTVDDGKQRRSFECGFGTRITGFKLRAITPGR